MASDVLRKAIEKVRKSGRLRLTLSSDEIDRIGAGLRQRAIFSAKVANAGVLDGIRDVTERVLRGEISPLSARERLRSVVERSGYQPPVGKAGGIEDLSSDQRLDLIVRTNRDMARGYGRFASAQKTLDEYPYWELYRAEPRQEPRDWVRRWAEAGGRTVDGRPMAPVNSGIWTRISRFGVPYPPFDFNSGMGVRRVSRRRVEGKARIPRQTARDPLRFDRMKAEVPDDPRLARQLLEDLGDGYQITDGVVEAS